MSLHGEMISDLWYNLTVSPNQRGLLLQMERGWGLWYIQPSVFNATSKNTIRSESIKYW